MCTVNAFIVAGHTSHTSIALSAKGLLHAVASHLHSLVKGCSDRLRTRNLHAALSNVLEPALALARSPHTHLHALDEVHFDFAPTFHPHCVRKLASFWPSRMVRPPLRRQHLHKLCRFVSQWLWQAAPINTLRAAKTWLSRRLAGDVKIRMPLLLAW